MTVAGHYDLYIWNYKVVYQWLLICCIYHCKLWSFWGFSKWLKRKYWGKFWYYKLPSDQQNLYNIGMIIGYYERVHAQSCCDSVYYMYWDTNLGMK